MLSTEYLSFEGVSSDHRIILAKIYLRLCKNKKQTVKASHYNWFSLTNSDISSQYAVIVKNKFEIL